MKFRDNYLFGLEGLLNAIGIQGRSLDMVVARRQPEPRSLFTRTFTSER